MEKYILLSMTCICLLGTSVAAMERFDIVTTHELQQMLEKRSQGDIDFLLVNTLDEIIFRHSAIPGSINLPWSQVSTNAAALGADKNKMIVTY